MRKGHTLFAVVLSLAMAGNAQDVSLTGTVTGGSAIAGARVSVKNYPHLAAYTDASGVFSLSGSLPAINQIRDGSITALPFIKNNRLVFSAAMPGQTIKVEEFSPNGKRLSPIVLTAKTSGSMSIPLCSEVSGLRLIRVTVGKETYCIKMLSGIGAGNSVSSFVRSNPVLGKSTAGFVDTLIVTAQGYKHSLIGITAFNQQNIQISLTASNTWKPSGALTRDKGMVKIMAKGYDFEMGQPNPNVTALEAGEIGLSEQPVHTVSFTYDFWMDTTEVTQKEYDSTMRRVYADFTTCLNLDALYGKGDRYPMYYIYWGNAALYCNARSKNEGLDTVYSYTEINAPTGEVVELFNEKADLSKNGYRLPTEAEWEYACRGGAATDFYWGKNYLPYPSTAADSAEVKQYSIWRANSSDFEGAAAYGAHQVGTTKPNAYGLYDMAGNVSEHIHDLESIQYSYGTVSDPAGTDTGMVHLLRGGNWGNDAVCLRSANRNFKALNYPFFHVGFRAVKPIR